MDSHRRILAKQSAILACIVALIAIGVAIIGSLIANGTVPHWRALTASAVTSFLLTFALTFGINYNRSEQKKYNLAVVSQ